MDMNNIVINGDIFIIPNRPAKLKNLNFFDSLNMEREMIIASENLMNNGFALDPENDLLFKFWIVPRDLYQDHRIPHQFDLKKEDKTVTRFLLRSNYLPEKLFEGKKEGDVVSIRIPIYILNSPTGDPYELLIGAKEPDIRIVTFNLRLAQMDYRYRMHGRFEQVMEKINALYEKR